LTVSVHPAVHPALKQDEIEGILKGMSDILQGKTDASRGNNCKVEFKFDGFTAFIPAPPFTSAPAEIKTADDLEAVHSVPADVKVVQHISFCVGEPRPKGVPGCAWRQDGQRTVIVARDGFLPGLGSPRHDRGIGPVIWAHEFGHTTGLNHRYQEDRVSGGSANLMTPCELQAFSQQINQDECAHFRAGPKPPPYQRRNDACPASLQPLND
jgi:hypothetical protein